MEMPRAATLLARHLTCWATAATMLIALSVFLHGSDPKARTRRFIAILGTTCSSKSSA
jgi:hypothetical protein